MISLSFSAVEIKFFNFLSYTSCSSGSVENTSVIFLSPFCAGCHFRGHFSRVLLSGRNGSPRVTDHLK